MSARDIIRDAKVKIMELPYFEEKVDVVAALLELEWLLREERNDLPEELVGEREEPWGD
jgi:hypothetical protein